MLVIVAIAELKDLRQLALLNVKDIRAESLTILIYLDHLHTVGERRDVQHVQECSLRCTDFCASLNQFQIRCDFNGTTSNLRGNSESLEERGLARFHTSVTCGNVDIEGSDCTRTGRGCDLVGQNLVADRLEVVVGKDEANIT